MNQYPYAMTPTRIGGVLFKNRIVSAPSTMHSLSNGELYPSEDAISFFESRARAGVGMVTVAGLKTGKNVTDDGQNTAWDVNQPNHRNKLMELVERVHFYGAKISMELIGIFPDGYTVSDGCSIMGWAEGHEITREAMEAFKEEWAQAAADLVDCGFDAILIHSGHSVPLAQFLSPLTNKRTDEYGGSTENRCRYLIEILDAIRARVGKKLLIEVRISGTEFEEGGIDIEEGIRIGELIQDHLDILQVSAGMHNPKWMTWVHPCGFRPPMPNIEVAEAFKKSGKIHVPIVALGAVESLDAAEEILREGEDLKLSTKVLDSILNSAVSYSSSYDRIFEAQKKVVLELSASPCIIVGRCADHILREAGIDAFSIYLYASIQDRMQRARDLGENGEMRLDKYIEKRDAHRRTYYKKYTGHEMGEAANYSICFDTGRISVRTCTDVVIRILEEEQRG